MKKHFTLVLGLSLLLLATTFVSLSAAALSETEPNDTPATANPLTNAVESAGSISPTGDVDYYALDGVNPSWGFIALLDTSASTAGTDGTLTALANDGTTVLQSDTGSWANGSGIALQSYADGSATHYLRVTEDGDDAMITPYTVRYYNTIVASQPEAESNDSRSTGTPSSFTHAGTIDTPGDVDCFSFEGHAGDTILVALDGDPEEDGSTMDPALELIGPDDTVLASADQSGIAGKEFLEYVNLADAGVYAYCVSAGAGVGSPTATYKVGIVRNGGLYFPSYKRGTTWLNPPSSGFAQVSDTLSFRLAITNTSAITIPGDIDLFATYSDSLLSFVSAHPVPTSQSPGSVKWNGQKTGLAPGEVYSVTVDLRAKATGSDTLHQSTLIRYYYTGAGSDALYRIATPVYLPYIQRSDSQP